jgi:hypothetical protein
LFVFFHLFLSFLVCAFFLHINHAIVCCVQATLAQ